jgi:hypothetical protein
VLFAINSLGERVKPTPNAAAVCPNCGSTVIAKCGEINIHHWAHENLQDCDSWNHESITQWHLDWQSYFPQNCCEIYINNGMEVHRADIKGKGEKIIEVQNSPISTEDIYKRETFYGNMLWVINTEEFKHNLAFTNYKVNFGDIMYVRFITSNPAQENSFIIEVPFDDNGDINKALQNDNNFQPFEDPKTGEEKWLNSKPIYGGEIPLEIEKAFTNYLLNEKLEILDKENLHSTNFHWNYLRRTWLKATKKRILDLNNNFLFFINTLHENGNGHGWIISKMDFIKKFKP